MKDEDKMPFGKHKGTPIGEVDASYLLWLGDQDWIESWADVNGYINKKRAQLEQEARKGE